MWVRGIRERCRGRKDGEVLNDILRHQREGENKRYTDSLELFRPE